MSMYNMINGFSPACVLIMPMLGRKQEEWPRFRDCFVTEDNNIAIYTRVGGGNRNAGYNEEKLYEDPLFIKTYDDEEFFYVDITDDGVGFDVNKKPDENDERSHVGVSNIKTRLKEMLKATVEVESTVGVGTKVLVKIPKNDETRLEEC